MANCQSTNTQLFGRAVVLEVADGCADTAPANTEWKALMAGTSKGLDYSPNTVTSDADDTKGFVENIVTNSDLSISFDGEVRVNDKTDEYGFFKLERYYTTEINNARQPSIWVRMKYGENVFTGYMVITSLSWSGGTGDIVTASLEFKVSAANTIKIVKKEVETEE